MIRVKIRKITGTEPIVPVTVRIPLEFHGNDYCGWAIPSNVLNSESIIVDVGVGEDISFSQSLIAKYGCTVEGFDPTPRAADFIAATKPQNFKLHDVGLSDSSANATFYLPTNEQYVSGSVISAQHLGGQRLDVRLVDLADLMDMIGADRIDLLKIDIEGSEYAVLESPAFGRLASRVHALCVEFHHRWPEIGPDKTAQAVGRLNGLGYECAWRSPTTNEEFLFVRPSR